MVAVRNKVVARMSDAQRRPGALRARAKMKVHTRPAQALLNPRPLPDGFQPPGLFRFSKACQQLCRESALDDPYADWFLWRIEQEMQQTRELVRQTRQRLDGAIQRCGFEVELAESTRPVTVELSMGNPYGYMAAYLVADYDELVRLADTCQLLGIYDRAQVWSLLRGIDRRIRRIFHLPLAYRHTGVCREDVRHGTQVAKRAEQLMGELPRAVLERHDRPRHAPPRVPAPTTVKKGR